ncbi:hypothetical protein [Nisaea sediminum]|uniref:hypothetical protein n=1 Tax=Nisaea sediminum TaxID=2775867 RepID=UPI001867F367|nr:hypothetical protein [Nisaea sediminum]
MSRTLVATMMSATGDNQEEYVFTTEDDDIWQKTPLNIIRAFAEYVDEEVFPKEMVDFEINASFKNEEHKCVTAMGQMVFERGRIPFTLMIGERKVPK